MELKNNVESAIWTTKDAKDTKVRILNKYYFASLASFVVQIALTFCLSITRPILLLCLTAISSLSLTHADNFDSINIGWSGPLTGKSAVLGVDSVESVAMVIDKVNQEGGINGRKLRLLVEDDQYDTAKAVSAYTKLALLDKCSVIIANTYGGVFATAQRAQSDGVVLINPLDCNDELAALPESTLCLATQSESVGIAIADEIIKRGNTPVGILFDQQNPFMLLVEKTVLEKLSTSGSEPGYLAAVDSNERDFRPQLLKARQAGVRALVLLGHDSMGQAMAQARQLGLDAQFYTIGTITSPGFQALAGSAAEGSLVAFWEAPLNRNYQEFIEGFKTRVGRAPILDLASVPSYDTAMLIVAALKKAVSQEGELDKKLFLSSLYQVKNYDGASGVITIDTDGAVRTIKERIYRFSEKGLKQDED